MAGSNCNQINDSGQVAWSGGGGSDGGRDWEIFLYSGGVTTQLTANSNDDWNPQINNSGQVAWEGYGSDGGYDLEIFLASPTPPCTDTRPSLTLNRTGVFWDSYADYVARELTVNFSMANTGADTAYQVKITGSSNTGGVTLSTGVPALVGDIADGGSSSISLMYHIPEDVTAFRTTIYATAQDTCGTSYNYPGP